MASRRGRNERSPAASGLTEIANLAAIKLTQEIHFATFLRFRVGYVYVCIEAIWLE